MTIQVNSNLLGLKLIDLTDDTQVNAGATNNQDILPFQGVIYKMIGIRASLPDPVGSSSGSHRLSCLYPSGGDNEFTIGSHMFVVVSDWGGAVEIIYSQLQGDIELPSDSLAQTLLLTNTIQWHYPQILRFQYNNHTDVDQTGTRKLNVLVAVYKKLL